MRAELVRVTGDDATTVLGEVFAESDGERRVYVSECASCNGHRTRRNDLGIAIFDLLDHAEHDHDGWRS